MYLTEKEQEAVRLYHQKLQIKEIAEITGIPFGSVKRLFHQKLNLRRNKKMNLERPYEHLPKDKINKIITLANFGYTNDEIAYDQEVSTYIVERIIEDHDRTGKNIAKGRT